MKKIIFAITILLIAGTAQAQIKSKTLLDALKGPRTSQDYMMALGYMRGIRVAHEMYQGIGARNKTFVIDGAEKSWPRSCVPHTLKMTKMASHWVYWADQPGQLDKEAGALSQILRWMFVAYPCGEAY
jgi:hypothetical protein